MAYYGSIPEAPDVRQQRPGYFNKPAGDAFSNQFVHPQGMDQFDPSGDQWENTIPDLWPEIQQNLRQIMEEARQPYLLGTPEAPLTPEQENMQKTQMAWRSPGGLQAIETGKYREQQAKYTQVDRAEKRVATIEKQLLQAHKAEAPLGLTQQLEKRYNASVKQLDTALKADDGEASGYPLFTGEGKMKLQGVEEKPGIVSKLKDWFSDIGGGGQVPELSEEGFQTPESIAQGPADVAPQKSNLMLRGLLEMDRLMAKYLGSDKAKEVTDQIVKTNPVAGGEGVPTARLEQAVNALPAEAQKDPEVVKLKRQLTIWNMTPGRKQMQAAGPPPGQTAESMPILRRYQRGIPEPGGG